MLGDLVLPEGVTILGEPDMVLIHVVVKKAEAEPTPAAGAEGTATQPEVIGRKEKKEGEDEAPAKK